MIVARADDFGAEHATAKRSGQTAARGVLQGVCPGASGSISIGETHCAGPPGGVSLPRFNRTSNAMTVGLLARLAQ